MNRYFALNVVVNLLLAAYNLGNGTWGYAALHLAVATGNWALLGHNYNHDQKHKQEGKH